MSDILMACFKIVCVIVIIVTSGALFTWIFMVPRYLKRIADSVETLSKHAGNISYAGDRIARGTGNISHAIESHTMEEK